MRRHRWRGGGARQDEQAGGGCFAASIWLVIVGVPALFEGGGGPQMLLGIVVALLVIGIAWLALRGAERLRAFRVGARDDRGGARKVPIPGDPPGVIEIDPSWPGRTRLRIPAPEPLPMLGPARLAPPKLRYGRASRELRWSGRGAEDGRRWDDHFRPHIEAINRRIGGGRLQATLTPAGLIVHLPLVVPRAKGIDLLRDAGAGLSRALHRIATEPDLEGIRLGAATEEESGTCSICWEALDDEVTTCERCGARQHDECSEWAGGCGRFACEESVELGAV